MSSPVGTSDQENETPPQLQIGKRGSPGQSAGDLAPDDGEVATNPPSPPPRAGTEGTGISNQVSIDRKDTVVRKAKKMSDMEAIMIMYGYTPEAIDQESFREQSVVQGLEAHMSDYSGVRLFFIKAANSFSFQAFFCTLIVMNAVTMGFEADADSKSTKDIYLTLESVYCALFLIEVIVRIGGSVILPWKDVALVLDTLIVLIGVIDNWVLNAAGVTGDDSNANVDLSVLTVLRVLRVVRVLRVFRAIAVFRPIRVLMASMFKALMNLVWIALLLLVLFYCFGLTFRMLLGDIDGGHSVRHVVNQYFDSVGQCIVTGLEVLLGGFNWTTEITTPLMNHADTKFASIVWLIFVALVHVCVANMIVGVFVEQLLGIAKQTDEQVAKEQLVTKMANIVELKKAFDQIDSDMDGKVSRGEFNKALKDIPELATAIGLTAEEANNIFDSVDYSADSTMEIEELIFGVVKLRGGSKSIDQMCFDYQIKQVIRQMQRSPQSFKELGKRIEQFETHLKKIFQQMEVMSRTAMERLPEFSQRLSRLEEQMSSFLTGLQVPQTKQQQFVFGGSAAATPPLSLANLRESYQLAEEMKELRKVVEAATTRKKALSSAPAVEAPKPAAAAGRGNPNLNIAWYNRAAAAGVR